MPNGDQTTAPDSTGWMSDVQRALALILIGSFAIVTLLTTVVAIFKPTSIPIADMAKSLQSNLTNMCLIGLGFFFGNTMAKMAQDAGQQKVVDKLTSTAPPTGGPVAPLAGPTVVVAWWSLLTDAEKVAITESAKTDPAIQAVMANFVSGKAEPPDLAALVAANLLTQARADAIKG